MKEKKWQRKKIKFKVTIKQPKKLQVNFLTFYTHFVRVFQKFHF